MKVSKSFKMVRLHALLLSVEDACMLFKPERMSARKALRIIKSEDSIGKFSFARSRENISTLKKLGQKG